jgi:hypothetical protein
MFQGVWSRIVLLGLLTLTMSTDVSSTSANSRDMIAAAAKRYGVPIELALIVAEVESHTDCFARGLAGELGPLQIKPETARLIGYTGPEFALQSCGEGLEWGMKHLALALQHGGVWKHNQGLWAKQRSAYGTKYERTVLASYICRKLSLHKPRPMASRQMMASKM